MSKKLDFNKLQSFDWDEGNIKKKKKNMG